MSIVAHLKNKIHAEITSALEKAREQGELSFISLPNFAVEVPREKAHGDFATNAAMLLTKEARQAPRVIAQTLVNNLADTGAWLEKTEIAGPGFINFYLKPDWIYQTLPVVLAQD